MYNQLQEHLNKYGILAEEQFGFRADSTTNKAMYKLINETLNALTFWRRNYFFNFSTPCI